MLLNKDFRWRPNLSERSYWDVLNMFIDRRHSSYSIHQIGQFRLSEKADKYYLEKYFFFFSSNGTF